MKCIIADYRHDQIIAEITEKETELLENIFTMLVDHSLSNRYHSLELCRGYHYEKGGELIID